MRIRDNKNDLLLGLGVFAVVMLFAIYTRHAWEDWYITFRPAKNLATGHGLVYNYGERVHTFTSVLGTLIPALLSFLTGNASDDLVLWLFRILNAGVFAVSVVLIRKASRNWFSGPLPLLLLLAGLALDSKSLDFAINGMETPYTILGLSLFFYFVSFHPMEKLGIRLGIVWALLQYTRPDGIIFAFLLASGILLFRDDRRAAMKTLTVSAGFALLLFAPWGLFATWYFGSPIPHSLVAKSVLVTYSVESLLRSGGQFLFSMFLLRPSVFDTIFSPAYAPIYGVFPWLLVASRVLGTAASCIWLFPQVKSAGRIASLGCFGYATYLSLTTPLIYPWYIPGVTLLALVALSSGLDALPLAQVLKQGPRKLFGAVGAAIFIAATLGVTLVSAHQFRYIQSIIETNHRKVVGLWLRDHAQSSRETVMLECVGYMGFFSGLKTYDWPGMTSPEMVDARKSLHTENLGKLAKYLRPDWLVLRPEELREAWLEDSVFIQRHYQLQKVFNANEDIDRLSYKPFEPYFRSDAVFLVIRKINTSFETR